MLAVSLCRTLLPPLAMRLASVTARGFHPCLLQVFGSAVVDGREGIVMELCVGNLASLLVKRTRHRDVSSEEVRAIGVCLIVL